MYKLSPVENTFITIRHILLPENLRAVFNIDSNVYVISESGIDKFLTKNRSIEDHPRHSSRSFSFPVQGTKNSTSCKVGNTILTVFSEEVTRGRDTTTARGGDTLPPASQVFDTATEKWSGATNLKVKRSGFAMVEYEGKVWVTGGRTKIDLYLDKDEFDFGRSKWCDWQVKECY